MITKDIETKKFFMIVQRDTGLPMWVEPGSAHLTDLQGAYLFSSSDAARKCIREISDTHGTNFDVRPVLMTILEKEPSL